MASIDLIKASDGTGNASIVTVQADRSPGASTIIGNTTQGLPSPFYASMGEPHTFIDPVSGEEITVISEATAVDFKGEIDGTNLEIDAIANGYLDTRGSKVGDIVVIKPTTEWADNVAAVLEESHEDDGSLKEDTVGTAQVQDKAITPDKLNTGADMGYGSNTFNTASTTFVTSSTSVTVNIGTNGLALVSISCAMNNGGSGFSIAGYSISGATTLTASDNKALTDIGSTSLRKGITFLETGLNPGSTTFTFMCRVTASNSNFQDRRIVAVPL